MRVCLLKEVKYRMSRSSGPGGQHVNRTESRVELIWKPGESVCLNKQQKHLIMGRLHNRISNEGNLILASEKYRSQHKNREDVTARFLEVVRGSLEPVKTRKPTGPTRSGVEKRIMNKKKRGALKKLRRGPSPEND